ncbi:universal stress protein [Mucilaginibacter boryungensis]|uniref:Universal stress protein n=1 Tax=Mucilaginibacter boryungensis TaxID=768480 RepID=A0ABR9XMT1_9SPHI|nr:universal stress protein [Mucilaginibacter boryungensis]MBE9668531.1 universal stress protein [Mucilaginibacter boryungensis]
MRTIVIATDFSEGSKDAARYGYQLARRVRSNVLLCHAIIIPAEIPQAGIVFCQDEEYELLLDDSATALHDFKEALDSSLPADGFRPVVSCKSQPGIMANVVKDLAATPDHALIVSGTHQGGLFSDLLVGNHASNLIDSADKPVLLVAPGTKFSPVKKIAFATEFKDPKNDLEHIYQLVYWARQLNAEVLLVHICSEKNESPALKEKIADYLLGISNNADYPNIYYRLIRNDCVDEGLDWICDHGQIDMLAMVHQPRNLFGELFAHSHTKQMAGHLQLPLLVFPGPDHKN